jgi:dihydroflavonol-4-reductase
MTTTEMLGAASALPVLVAIVLGALLMFFCLQKRPHSVHPQPSESGAIDNDIPLPVVWPVWRSLSSSPEPEPASTAGLRSESALLDERYRTEEAALRTAQDRGLVLVTGAAGFLGNVLVRSLLRQGRNVRVFVLEIDRASLGDVASELEVFVGDITRADDVMRAMVGVRTVYHLASLVSLLQRDLPVLQRVNVEGTRHVVDACLRCAVDKLLYVGSIHALAALPEDEPITEQRPLATAAGNASYEVSPYDLTKARAEQLVIDALGEGLRAVRITPVGIWGPGDRLPSLLGKFLLQLWDREHLMLPSGGFNFADVRDIAHGLMRAEEYGQIGKRYLFKGRFTTMPQLAARIRAVTGEGREWTVPVPMWAALSGAHIAKHFTGDSIGFNPNSIRPFLYHQQVAQRVAPCTSLPLFDCVHCVARPRRRARGRAVRARSQVHASP